MSARKRIQSHEHTGFTLSTEQKRALGSYATERQMTLSFLLRGLVKNFLRAVEAESVTPPQPARVGAQR